MQSSVTGCDRDSGDPGKRALADARAAPGETTAIGEPVAVERPSESPAIRPCVPLRRSQRERRKPDYYRPL